MVGIERDGPKKLIIPHDRFFAHELVDAESTAAKVCRWDTCQHGKLLVGLVDLARSSPQAGRRMNGCNNIQRGMS